MTKVAKDHTGYPLMACCIRVPANAVLLRVFGKLDIELRIRRFALVQLKTTSTGILRSPYKCLLALMLCSHTPLNSLQQSQADAA